MAGSYALQQAKPSDLVTYLQPDPNYITHPVTCTELEKSYVINTINGEQGGSKLGSILIAQVIRDIYDYGGPQSGQPSMRGSRYTLRDMIGSNAFSPKYLKSSYADCTQFAKDAFEYVFVKGGCAYPHRLMNEWADYLGTGGYNLKTVLKLHTYYDQWGKDAGWVLCNDYGFNNTYVNQNCVADIARGWKAASEDRTGQPGSPSGGPPQGKKVKAMFTAYYPADDPVEGGFYDALGKLLDPSKHTCAAPKSVPFGSIITIQDTGTERDGQSYEVNDRGGAITIVNDVYHFDILMSSNSECNNWGVKYGTAIISDPGSVDLSQSYSNLSSSSGGGIYLAVDTAFHREDASVREFAYLDPEYKRVFNAQKLRLSVINYIPLVGNIAQANGSLLSNPGLYNNPNMDTSALSGNCKIVIDYLLGKGLNGAAACAVAANIEAESGFRPDAVGDHGTSFGICQWHNERGTSMKNFVGTNWRTNLTGQLDYLWKDLNTGYTSTLRYLQNVPNTEQGCRDGVEYFVYHFEIPADKPGATARRQPIGVGYFNSLKVIESGKVPDGAKWYWLGDSRFVGMEYLMGDSEKSISKVGAGYSWLKSNAIPEVTKLLRNASDEVVIFGFGVNDYGTGNTSLGDKYIQIYNDFITRFNKVKVVIPYNSAVRENSGHNGKTRYIKQFNQLIQTNFPRLTVDIYTPFEQEIQTSTAASSDGLHYSNSLKKKIYDMIKAFVLS